VSQATRVGTPALQQLRLTPLPEAAPSDALIKSLKLMNSSH